VIGRKITFLEAISQAIREEMQRDEAVFLLAEDMGTLGESFNINSNLLEEFGSERVIGIPMSEAALIGSVVGAALMGMRPIAGMPMVDLDACNFEQLMHMAMQMYWRTAATSMPIVIRGSFSGVETEGRAFPEARFFYTPGIKVVAPSTPYDAKGMLKAAIRDNDPVLYLEHMLLYRMPELCEELPTEDYTVPLNKAIIRREGEDMTILTYGVMVHQCLRVAQVLEEDDDLAVEVLDLRSLSPLDSEAILESVKRTNKVLIVHEGALARGIGAELSAMIADNLYDEYLDGPITSLAPPEVSLSYALSWEQRYFPCTQKILSAARELAAY
jgi:2-oxoisovalerate dehydrogenase E1 component beta subunit